MFACYKFIGLKNKSISFHYVSLPVDFSKGSFTLNASISFKFPGVWLAKTPNIHIVLFSRPEDPIIGLQLAFFYSTKLLLKA